MFFLNSLIAFGLHFLKNQWLLFMKMSIGDKARGVRNFVKFGGVNVVHHHHHMGEDYFFCWDYINISQRCIFSMPKAITQASIIDHQWCNWLHYNVALETSWTILISEYVSSTMHIIVVPFNFIINFCQTFHFYINICWASMML